jgi:acetyl esterase/lipase
LHPYPAAEDDALEAYKYLIEELDVSPSSIVIAGDSAGGGLTVAALVAIRESGMPLPAGAVLLSPWVLMDPASAGEGRSD